MFITMLRTIKGSNDGIKVEKFVEGQKYSVPQDVSFSLCKVFIDNGYAGKVAEAIENKMIKDEDVELLDDVVEDANPVEHKVFAKSEPKETPSEEVVEVPKKVKKPRKPKKK